MPTKPQFRLKLLDNIIILPKYWYGVRHVIHCDPLTNVTRPITRADLIYFQITFVPL